MTYRGRVADLLGLNWSEMAHASSRRTGVVGHSGFNLEVFWKHPPELMLPESTKPTGPQNLKGMPANFELAVLQGLMNERRFREEYSPVVLHVGDGTMFAYARESFVDRHQGDSRIEVLPWQQLRDAPAETALTTH